MTRPKPPPITIDPEFAGLFPVDPSTVDAIRDDGVIHEPLITWRGILVDGHTRLATGLPYRTEPLDDELTRGDVKAWMFARQCSTRRNLTPDQIVMTATRLGVHADGKGVSNREAERLNEYAPDLAERVCRGGCTVKVAYNRAVREGRIPGVSPPARRVRPASPAPEASPPAEPAEPVALHRAKRAESAAKSESKAMAGRLAELEDALEFLHARPTAPPTIVAPTSRPKSGLRIADPVFIVSDTHFGETVTEAETMSYNRYDLAEAARRMAKCWDNMLWLRRDMARTQSCDNTILSLNGDIVSGDIHDELRETNDGGLGSQCDAAVEALYPGIVAMIDATPGIVHIICIGGNHGRLTHKQHIKNGTEHSVEHIGVYGPLRRMIGDRGGKVAWHIPKAERFRLTVHERRVSFQHGTMIRSQGGIGGTLVPMTRWVTRSNDAELYIFGHFHEADAYGKIIKNGALIGPSAYTKWLGIEDRPPEQVCFALDADAGVRRFERVSVT